MTINETELKKKTDKDKVDILDSLVGAAAGNTMILDEIKAARLEDKGNNIDGTLD